MSASGRLSLSAPVRLLVGLTGAAVLAAPALVGAPAVAKPFRAELGTWSTAPDVTPAVLDGQSIRNVIRTSVGGTDLRISLSNAFGDRPVTFDAVRVGRVLSDSLPGAGRRGGPGGQAACRRQPGCGHWPQARLADLRRLGLR